MLIRLFKTQEPFNLIILLILAFGIRLPYLLNSEPIPVFNYNEPFSSFLFNNFPDLWTNKLFNTIFTTLIYFSIGIWLNKIINDYGLLFKNTLLPALVFIIITAIFPTFYTMDAAILIIFLQLLLFITVIKLFKTNQGAQKCFDAGVIVALASLFYFPAIAWIVLVWFSLIIFRPFVWREWVSSILGVLTLYIFLAFYYYWTNRWDDFLLLWSPLKGSFWQINVFPRRSDYLPLFPIVLILIIAFNKLFENFYKNVLLVRKVQQIMVISILITAFSYYIKPSFKINHFILLAAPMTLFLSYYFLVAKKMWVAEGLLWLMIISVIVFQVV
ncbi:MAG: DUF6427 family protein [bacterium]